MKKYFIFAAVATAGLFASCSSSDDITEATGTPSVNSDETPIVLNVSQRASAEVTRGTGTVGGILDADNLWDGEHVNVYMFNKGTFTVTQDGQGHDLFNNTEMRAPQNPAYADPQQLNEYVLSDFENPGQTPADEKTYVKHRYYPATGEYDFWAYHLDDAVADAGSDPVVGANNIIVPFKIDGSQDLMVAAAWPDATELTTLGTTGFYKAASARKGVHPNLFFQHLLTRLTFTVKGGNAQACGWTGTPLAAPTDGDTYRGIFVKSIKVYSRNTGEMVAAYNYWDDAALKPNREKTALVSWDYDESVTGNTYAAAYAAAIAQTGTDVVPFSLMGKKDVDAAAVTWTAATAAYYNATLAGAVTTNDIDPTTATNYTATTAAAYNATLTGAFPNDGSYVLQTGEAAIVNAAINTTYSDGETLSVADADAYNATLTGHVTTSDPDPTTATHYSASDAAAYNATLTGAVTVGDVAIAAHTGNGKLTPLYSNYFDDNDKDNTWVPALTIGSLHHPEIYKPTLDPGTNLADENATEAALAAGAKVVGSAMLVSPEESYKMVVELGQLVLDLSVPAETEATDIPGTKDKYDCVFTTLPAMDLTIGGGFQPGTSYNVVLTAYSNTEIIVKAVLQNWVDGGDVDVPLE